MSDKEIELCKMVGDLAGSLEAEKGRSQLLVNIIAELKAGSMSLDRISTAGGRITLLAQDAVEDKPAKEEECHTSEDHQEPVS